MSSTIRPRDDPLEGDLPYAEGEQIEEDEEDEDEAVNLGAYEDEIYESESPSESGTESLTWISWFCSLPGHEYFAEVGEDFIEDDFNLTGLNALVPFYKEALEMILDVEPPEEDSLKIPDVSIVESSAELLYGLIHQRYILTRHGMQQMVDKYEAGHFGYCPRVFCHSHPVLPCGRSDLPGLDTVKLFCPNCIDNYSPPSSRFHGVDGAFFGTTFPHLLYQCYRDLFPSIIAPKQAAEGAGAAQQLQYTPQQAEAAEAAEVADAPPAASAAQAPTDPPVHRTIQPEQLGKRVPYTRTYTPKIYGFKVSEYAKTGPRMKWMRMRPTSLDQLDRL
ncbi:related to CKB1-casein kinase II, beta subunit [Sporisorium reilianum SRZ2]|uniref:Casein kinase II subunit beta n=1 Tax=Sporisorium reilianum (strain SRZ2) TaxID=999809 RepID=E6ZTD9_SPORE|nr:related to CKB1-casein kinase II, beta subunit [Sporisorium reilianum SRZ2]